MKNLLSAVAVAFAVTFLVAPVAHATQYGLSIDVQQVEENLYELAAEVRELGSDRLVAAPRVQFQEGIPAMAETAVPDSDTLVRLEAEVNEDGTKLVYSLVVNKGSVAVAQQSAAVSLD